MVLGNSSHAVLAARAVSPADILPYPEGMVAAPCMGGQGFAPDLAPNHPMALGSRGHTRMSPTVNMDTLVRVGWQGSLQAPAAPSSPHDSSPRPQHRARQRPEGGGHTEWGAQTRGKELPQAPLRR